MLVYMRPLSKLTMSAPTNSTVSPVLVPGRDGPSERNSATAGNGRQRGTSPSLPESYRSVPVVHGASFFRKMIAFAGPGYLVAVGYMDPGNWATDLGGGSRFGYTLSERGPDFQPHGHFFAGPIRKAGHRHGPRSCAGLPRALFAPDHGDSLGPLRNCHCRV